MGVFSAASIFSKMGNRACFFLVPVSCLSYLGTYVVRLHLCVRLDDADNYWCVFKSLGFMSGFVMAFGCLSGIILSSFQVPDGSGKGLLDNRHYMYGGECSVDCY